MGINVGLSNWIKFDRSLQKKFALACLGKKVTGKVGQNFLMYKCPVWEPWGIPRCKWGPHPKSRVSSFKIDESPTLDVRENGSGYSPLCIFLFYFLVKEGPFSQMDPFLNWKTLEFYKNYFCCSTNNKDLRKKDLQFLIFQTYFHTNSITIMYFYLNFKY